MNSFILLADIVQSPQLRYTSDNQTPVAEFIVQFPGLRESDAPSQLKVVGWGNLAQEIQGQYREGDRVLLEGRLSMNTVDRPEGFREKRAEMTLQRIQTLHALGALAMTPSNGPIATATTDNRSSAVNVTGNRSLVTAQSAPSRSTAPQTTAPQQEEPDYDDIPF